MSADGRSSNPLAFLAGGGEVGLRMRNFDWQATNLGPPQHWPQSLKTIVRVMLDSRYAMWMAWGPELTFFCNDAYLPTVGIKRDWVLGARSDEVWREIWPDIGPRIQHVLVNGQATWDEGLLLFLQRSGFSEETYHTFSYSPVYDDASRIAGMLCVVTEVTDRIIGERRLRVLRDLAAQAVGVETVPDSCQHAIQVLAQHPADVPFSALYLMSADGAGLQRSAVSRELPADWFPESLPLSDSDWKLGGQQGHLSRRVLALPRLGLQISAGIWPDPVPQAVILPLKSTAHERPLGFLIAGVSPRRMFDEPYSSFLDLVASQIASAIANARAHETERERTSALAEIDRAKTLFFSNVSHEFRTPLTLMLGPVEDMTTDVQVPEQTRSRLQVVHRNSLRLLKLVNSLLEFSRIEAGRVQASFEPTDLALLTRDLVSTFSSALELAGLSFTQQLPSLPDPVYVDRDMWERIVLNLLSNAFKYTLQGEIEVRLSQLVGHVQLSVRDTGIGIPPEAIPRLFNRFYRVEGAQGRNHEGTGIGLALVHELVRMHGGTVSVESEVGRGTTFTVQLPLGRAHLPAERVIAARPQRAGPRAAREYVQEALRWLPAAQAHDTGIFLRRSEGALARNIQPAGVMARVLIADDNADMRSYIRELLEGQYSVETVSDGEAALESARRAVPGLIVSDIMMPRLDGFQLLRALRADPELRDVPVILLSARAGEEAVIEGLQAMADDYLVKPFSARELLARVGAQLQLAASRRDAAAREQALRLQAEALLNESPLGVFVVGDDFRIREANPTAQRVLHNLPPLIGLDFTTFAQELWPPQYAEQMITQFRHTMASGVPYREPQRNEHGGAAKLAGYYEWRISRIPLPENRYGVVCYFTDVSAHVEARLALEAADRQKNEFLAMLAHELRNPLAPIRNAGEILSRTLPMDSNAHAIIGMVRRQVGQLTRLVDDLLDVSRITQGRVELKREPLELGAVISQAVEMVEPLFREHQHEVEVVSRHRALFVDGDMTRLVQSLVNVLTNATKYTDPGGRIRVHSYAANRHAVVEISDNGAGIPPELLPRVFELFVQGDRTLDRSLGGLGIGLSVARRLIQMHGGELTAASPGPGQGSTFTLRLPRIERASSLGEERPPPASPPKRVLVVDDNVDAADSLALVLELDGHTCESVYSAREALARAAEFNPDVILLDIGLPEMNGYEVARRLRELPALRATRLIALTGYGQTEDLHRARDAGFDDHLVKPVDFATLGRCVGGSKAGGLGRLNR